MLPLPADFYSDDQPREPAGTETGGRWTRGAGASTAGESFAAPVHVFKGRSGTASAAESVALRSHLHSLTTDQLRRLAAEHDVSGSRADKGRLVSELHKKIVAHREGAKAVAPLSPTSLGRGPVAPGPGAAPAGSGSRPPPQAVTPLPPLNQLHRPALYGSPAMTAYAQRVRDKKLAEAHALANRAAGDLSAKGRHDTARYVLRAFHNMRENRDSAYWLDKKDVSGGDMLRQEWHARYADFAEASMTLEPAYGRFVESIGAINRMRA